MGACAELSIAIIDGISFAIDELKRVVLLIRKLLAHPSPCPKIAPLFQGRTKMRFVFLDFDGVINSEALYNKQVELGLIHPESIVGHRNRLTEKGAQAYDDPAMLFLDPEAVARVQRICSEADAFVVLSTNWRYGRSMSNLRGLLRTLGLTARVIGRIPLQSRYGDRDRSEAIDHFLYLTNPEGYVILEDHWQMKGANEERMVRCDPAVGLTDEQVEEARQKINLSFDCDRGSGRLP